ncbi:glutamyl-tRNA reductase [Marininema halotolerans]|uniref:Glutamyl-tRNA reductase n=1 Tax=Marininema halotolerans TaxID=1155944 RepID=A0A1I6UCS0_9BACL|nr:glutamyl-tRNA reductase [Marininema halotolerans]SFS99201.1 glutamyl-tRNA reductase [Marininema halotolerans]
MHIIVTGFNHKTAPVELREQMTFTGEELAPALHRLRHMKSILECVVISTCNRLELYVISDQPHTGSYYSKSFLEKEFGIPMGDFVDHLYVKRDEQAVRHLFTVTCGLDSMVVGETQILGQVKNDARVAQEAGVTGTLLNHLFKEAVTLGKKVQSETEIGQNAVSVSYAAVQLGRKLFSTFTGKTVLLLGAGETGELTAKHLFEAGANRVIVVNRTLEKAEEVACRFRGEARSFTELIPSLREADIVVSSTGAPTAVIEKAAVQSAIAKRIHPLFLIDIAVPRDIDPAIHDLDNVYLFDIDDLQGIVEANIDLREQEADKVGVMIEEQMIRFDEWLQTLGVVPVITALREKALDIHEETMLRIERKLPDLTEREKRILRKHTKSIVNQLLRDPLSRIKELSVTPEKEQALELFVQIFALEEELATEKEKPEESVRSESCRPSMLHPAFTGETGIRS